MLSQLVIFNFERVMKKLALFQTISIFLLFNANLLLSQTIFEKTAKKNNFALEFDGLNDVVTVTDSIDAFDLDSFTLEAWVMRFDSNTQDVIIHKGASGENPSVNTNFGLFIAADNKAHVIWESANSTNYDLAGETIIEPNKWYHLAGVRSARENSLAIYVSGQLESQIVFETIDTPNKQDIPLILGYNGSGFPASDHLKGKIDEARVWNIPRTGNEIRSTMDRALHGTEFGLIGYWPLNEGEGQTVFDFSQFSRHGFLGDSLDSDHADPIWVESDLAILEPLPLDPADHALAFDGVDDIVTIPDTNNSLDLDAFTIEAWIYRLESGINNMIVSKSIAGENEAVNSNFWLWVKANNRAEVGWELPNSNNYAVEGETPIEPNRWYHLAGVRNAEENTLAIYVNGLLDSAPLITFSKPNTQNQAVFFGNTPGVSEEYHKGFIDEVRIWNKPLAQELIQSIMSAIITPGAEGLAGYWRFNECANQIINDLTMNGNDGFLGTAVDKDSADPVWIVSNAPLTDSITVDIQPIFPDSHLSSEFKLFPNYPNPFNPATIISYQLSEASDVEVGIYDSIGREVFILVRQKQPAGFYQVQWNGRDRHGKKVASGAYIYRLRAGEFVQTHRMLLTK